MNRAATRLRLLAALPFLLALAVDLLLFALWRDRLPDRLATHFGGDGRADGFTATGGFLAVSSGLLAALGAGWTLFVRRRVLWGAWATAGFAAAMLALTLRGNLDVTDPAEARLPLAGLTVALALAALVALAGWALTRLVPEDPAPRAPGTAGAPRLDLGAGELAGWARTAGSLPMSVLAGAFLLAAPVVLLLAPWPYALIPLAVGVPGAALSRVRVTADRRGLTVRPALAARPRLRVPLDDITGATARDVDPLGEFGGWGYRVRPGAGGVILRSGPALAVRRRDGREFVVTVDDAATAAGLLNALVARDGSRGA
ncbi:DUF1648 domain-containing protein [Streptomyces showdoensis]|uniref:DUF1648 domain-containing protein n=1 Tax=Streptomyces showdoensis TaxID=68268 RepID=A0A2P2GCT9_STREW|nr:DUF1648 domain-containing protein [Streptomyces showdoensis]KKZ69304.1 hypothetical protein VO63_34930 [Streptomyces showdoensis]